MIYDGISAIGRYRGLAKGLDVLIDWLGEHDDWRDLPTGRNEICGSKVFANVQDATTRTAGSAHYEVHRRYIDVQVDLVGCEAFRVTPGATVPLEDFDEARDYQKVDAAPQNGDEIEGTLAKGHFAAFFPGEPHMPNLVCTAAEPYPIHKICFKVLADEFWED